MKIKTLAVATFVVVSLPLAAYAQGTIRGAEDGAAAGDRAAGPLGAVVGGAIGAATGTVGGILAFVTTLSVSTTPLSGITSSGSARCSRAWSDALCRATRLSCEA
jgi:hypothetical protein